MAGDIGIFALWGRPVDDARFSELLGRLDWLVKDLGGAPWRVAIGVEAGGRQGVGAPILVADVFYIPTAPNADRVYIARGVTLEVAELLVQMKNNLPALIRRAASGLAPACIEASTKRDDA